VFLNTTLQFAGGEAKILNLGCRAGFAFFAATGGEEK
jgi:hypothetical protein